MYDKRNREKLGRISDQINGLLKKVKAEGRKGLNSDERITYHGLETDFSSTEEEILINEGGRRPSASAGGGISVLDLEELRDSNRLTPVQKRERERDRDPYARAFGRYIRAGMDSLEGEERSLMLSNCPDPAATGGMRSFRNTMSTTTGSQGGFVVPQGFSEQLEAAKKWFGGIDGVVGSFKTATGNPWPWPTVNDTMNRGRIIGQNVQIVETDLVFGQTTFGAYVGSSDLVLIPLALAEDSYFDMEGLVARLLGERLGRLYNWKATIGTGSNEPTGIVTAVVAAGNILVLPVGSTASIAYSNLVDMEHSVDPAYRYNPSTRFMFSDAMLKLLKKLVDSTGRPLWQPGLTASFRDGAAVDLVATKPTILDHPYIINQDMAAPAASAYSMLFGDMNLFKVRELISGTTVLVLRERYADYLQLGIMAFQRFDSNLVDAGTHPIAVMQQSAT